jgi:IS6 family transposase
LSNATLFKWRHFEAEIILLCVRWYLRYALSYRDLEEMMLERGLSVDHTTIYRWVQHYAPELEKRCHPHLKTTNDSWRVDETYRKVKGIVNLDFSLDEFPPLNRHVRLSIEQFF